MSGEEATTANVVRLENRSAWKAALKSPRPVLAHLNADTTWLLQLPIPASVAASRRSRYNILIDPWLQGPQSDVAAWFSTQWHVIAPYVRTMKELEEVLAELEDDSDPSQDTVTGASSHIDCVAISHEFTDHCHQATLVELPKNVPVVATEKAAELIRSWKHFDTVLTTPAFSAATPDWRGVLVDKTDKVPPWLGIGRVVTAGNGLYYHSAVIVVFDLAYNNQRSTASKDDSSQSEAVIYSPHGIKGKDLECVKAAGIQTLALLHGLHDVRIWLTAQLNLGALNGIQAVRASGARYWMSTHDERKKGGGFISRLLRRKIYSLADAVEAEKAKGVDNDKSSTYNFVELGCGDGLLLV